MNYDTFFAHLNLNELGGIRQYLKYKVELGEDNARDNESLIRVEEEIAFRMKDSQEYYEERNEQV